LPELQLTEEEDEAEVARSSVTDAEEEAEALELEDLEDLLLSWGVVSLGFSGGSIG